MKEEINQLLEIIDKNKVKMPIKTFFWHLEKMSGRILETLEKGKIIELLEEQHRIIIERKNLVVIPKS